MDILRPVPTFLVGIIRLQVENRHFYRQNILGYSIKESKKAKS